MQILLDTQTIVWYIEDDSLLTQNARQAIQHADLAYVSAINFYEIAIKLAIGKDAGVTQPLSEIIKRVLASGFLWLPLLASHIEAYSSIPLIGHHKDPFDRIILATALADGLTIVLSDHNFPLYNGLVETIW
jgi:PIN domain nuclease of toxin-antitoxin system